MHGVSMFALTFGAAWMVYAVVGIIRRKIRTFPRGIPGTAYDGAAAVRQSMVELLIGLAFFLIGLMLYVAS